MKLKNQLASPIALGLLFFTGLNSFQVPTALAYEVSFEKDSSLPRLNLHVAIKAGSVSDPQGKSGLTCFLTEMLLRGTKTRNKEQLNTALDQLGARLDAETRAESTLLRGAVLSSQLDAFLALLKEVLTEPSFPEKEIQKLKAETLSSLQEELGHDGTLASRRFSRFLFENHPYGNPILGTAKDISSITREDLLAHYRRLVRDELLLIVGSGDAEVERLSTWAKGIASQRAHIHLTETDQKLIRTVTPPMNANKLRVQIIDKPERTQTQITGGQIGIRLTDADFIPLYVGNHAFGGSSFLATLMVEIRVKRGWSYGAGSSFRHGLQPRSWYFHLYPAAKDTPAALALSVQLVRELKEKGLKREAFEFAKQSLINNAGFMYNTPDKRVENILVEKTLQLPEGFLKSYGPKIEKVTLNEVNQAFKSFLKPEKMAISILGTAEQLKGPIAKALGISEEEIQVKKYTEEDPETPAL